MNLYQIKDGSLVMSVSHKMVYILVLSVLLWSIGAPTFINRAQASQLLSISDTISDSNMSATTKHVIGFTTSNALNAGDTIKIQLDPLTHAFSQTFSLATSTDITGTGLSVVSTAANCSGTASEVYPVGNYNNGTDENITFTVCPTDSVAPGAKVLAIGTSTALFSNPVANGSYVIRITTTADSGDTRVAILSNVTVTASVNTIFTFTVTGVATSTVVNGITTTGSTTATAMAFNTLTPGASSSMAQTLSVSTNARNGFVVTVQENQNLTSTTGADIDLFANGATTSTPIPWVAPTNLINQDETYGHMGVTSNDADLNGGEFTSGGPNFAGNFNTPRQIFSHTGPANGTTQNEGLARVLYSIEIASMQEAGTDYTNTLTYVATPTF